MNDQKQLFIESASELRSWLQKNHTITESIWLVKWKKSAGKSYVNYDAIVDELICFGWVDSLPRKLDQHKTMLRISPRSPKSNWSGVNKTRVKRLTKNGKMHASGLQLVQTAKENGRWNFLDDVEQLIVPDDLSKALSKYEKATYFYHRFPDSSKRGILEWIKNAKQVTTRQKRIEETALKAAQNLKANHPKGRDRGPKVEY